MLTIRVLKLPYSAHPEEFDALAAEPDVDLRHVSEAADLGLPDMVILPGSERTIPDLEHLRATGLDTALRRALENGALLFGICGGFQMMGGALRDPDRLEGGAPEAAGLGVFDMSTVFTRELIDEPVRARGARGGFLAAGAPVAGFELHGGRSTLDDRDAGPLFEESAQGGSACPLGIATRDLSAMGTYLHGVLADPVFRARILEHLRERRRERDVEPRG